MPPDPTSDPRLTPPDPFDIVFPLRPRNRTIHRLQEIDRKVDAGEPVDIEPGGYRALTLGPVEMAPPDLDWKASYDELERRWKEVWKREKGRLQPIGPDPTFAIVNELDELNEWRRNYGRLDKVNDYDLTVIDWRPVFVGAAALALALIARWMVRDL